MGRLQCYWMMALGLRVQCEWRLSGFTAPQKRAACFVEQYTNCSLSYMQIQCPVARSSPRPLHSKADCPLVAPSPTFPCIFTCVKPQDGRAVVSKRFVKKMLCKMW